MVRVSRPAAGYTRLSVRSSMLSGIANHTAGHVSSAEKCEADWPARSEREIWRPTRKEDAFTGPSRVSIAGIRAKKDWVTLPVQTNPIPWSFMEPTPRPAWRGFSTPLSDPDRQRLA